MCNSLRLSECVCVWLCICAHSCVCVYLRACMHACVCVCVCARARARASTACMCVCVCVFMFRRETQTHTQRQRDRQTRCHTHSDRETVSMIIIISIIESKTRPATQAANHIQWHRLKHKGSIYSSSTVHGGMCRKCVTLHSGQDQEWKKSTVHYRPPSVVCCSPPAGWGELSFRWGNKNLRTDETSWNFDKTDNWQDIFPIITDSIWTQR